MGWFIKDFIFSIPLALLLVVAIIPLAPVGSAWKAYDPTAYNKCYAEPRALLYDGGIVNNPDFEDGLKGWSAWGNCALQLRTSNTTPPHSKCPRTNSFVVITNRTASYNGASQLLPNITMGIKYIVSAWLRVEGPQSQTPLTSLVKATLVVDGGKQYVCIGTVLAQNGCWSFLKGGFSLDYTPSSSTRLYFETYTYVSGLDIWLDRVSVQPFTEEEWTSHQRARIELLRRRTVTLRVVDDLGMNANDVDVEVIDAKMGFKFGSAITQNFLKDQHYQSWFLERFNTAVFGNELKWYATEKQQGHVDYNVSDAMVAFCEAHNLTIRGHNIVWDDPRFQQQWVKALPTIELKKAVDSRIKSVVGRYAGHFIDWDVSNEQLHYSFYEDALGDKNASTNFFLATHELDPGAQLFVNDYNTLESCNDPAVVPDKYENKIKDLEAAGVENLGIGLESHFTKPSVAFMRSTLDRLGTLGKPIWLTEVDIDVKSLSNNLTLAATYLEQVLREGYSHPYVNAIVLWTAIDPPAPGSCWRMCLTDLSMNNLPTGVVLDSLLKEWQRVEILAHSPTKGYARWRGPVGTHVVSIRSKSRNITYFTTLPISRGSSTQRFIFRLPPLPQPPPCSSSIISQTTSSSLFTLS